MTYRVIANLAVKNGQNVVHLKSDYGFNDRIKALPSRRWVKKARLWEARIIRANAYRILDWIEKGWCRVDSPDLVKYLEEKAAPPKVNVREFPSFFPWKTEPFPKQLEAEKFMYEKDKWALFADMGCGKSKMVIDVASAHLMEGRIDGLVVVSRVSVRENWVREMDKHCPLKNVNNLVLESKKSATKKAYTLQKPFFVSLGCESLSGRLAGGQVFEALHHIMKSHKCMIVVDESHYIKSPKSNRTKNVTMLGGYSEIRGIMTGTPVPRNILDLYSPYEFLDPDILGFPSHWKFKLTHTVMGGFAGKQILGFRDVDSIMTKTNPYTFRMHRDEVVQLPPLTRHPVMVRQDKKMRDAYISMKRDRELAIEDKDIIPRAEMVAVYTKLRALSSGYVTDDEKKVHWVVPPEKTPKIKELVEILNGTEEQAIIWTNNHAELQAVKAALGDRVIEYHGQIPITQREENLRTFKGDPRLSIVATVQSMQTGLTLTEATLEVFFSLPLSYTDFVQAEARAYRIGQDKKVLVLLMVTEDTVDMDILAALMEKKDVHDYVMERPIGERFVTAKPGIDWT